MKDKFIRFMYGRNGNDKLNMFILAVDLILLVVSSLLLRGAQIIHILVLALLGLAYFRMLSKNLYKRRDENEKYLRLRYKVIGEVKLMYERWVQRKDYKFFACPSCKTSLRVPRGHGKVKIVCRKCGKSFTGKT